MSKPKARAATAAVEREESPLVCSRCARGHRGLTQPCGATGCECWCNREARIAACTRCQEIYPIGADHICGRPRKRAPNEAYCAVRWRGEIRVTQRPHSRRSDACQEVFGTVDSSMETAIVGGPGRIAANNKLLWKRLG